MLRKNASARIHNLCRLGRTKFALIEYGYHAWPQHYTLFVYSFNPQGNVSNTPDHVATFNFPEMSLRTTPFTIIHSSFPPGPSEYHHIIQTKPNFTSHTSGIIQIRMIFGRTARPSGFQVFVSPEILLRAGKEQDGRPSVYNWDEWGRPNTRWFKDPLGRLAPTLRPYGYRVGFPDRILDFNPRELVRDICRGSPVDPHNIVPCTPDGQPQVFTGSPYEESPKSRIIREPTIMSTSGTLRQDIVSSLPYRETLCTLEHMSQSTFSYVDEGLYFVEVCLQPSCIIFHRNDTRRFIQFHDSGTATIHICTI